MIEDLSRVCWTLCTVLSTENKDIKTQKNPGLQGSIWKCILSLEELRTDSLFSLHLPPSDDYTENDLIQLSKTTYQWLTLRRKSQPLAAWMEASTIVLIPICPNTQVGRRNTGFFFFCYIYGNWNENKENCLVIQAGFRSFRSSMWLERVRDRSKGRENNGASQARQTFGPTFQIVEFSIFWSTPSVDFPDLYRSVCEPWDLKTLKNKAGCSK